MTASVIISKELRKKLQEMHNNVFAQQYVDKPAFPLESFIQEYKRCCQDYKDCFNPLIIHNSGMIIEIKKELGQRYELLKVFGEFV